MKQSIARTDPMTKLLVALVMLVITLAWGQSHTFEAVAKTPAPATTATHAAGRPAASRAILVQGWTDGHVEIWEV